METKEMTLKEAQNLVKDTKYIVWSKDESRQLQEKLLEIGCKWLNSGETIIHTEDPFLFVDEYLDVMYATKQNYKEFSKSTKMYMQTDSIISIKIKKPKFDPSTLQPFDKVLVRENDKYRQWFARFFERYEDNGYYTTSGISWKYCIPYNDETKHLVGTTDEAPEYYQV